MNDIFNQFEGGYQNFERAIKSLLIKNMKKTDKQELETIIWNFTSNNNERKRSTILFTPGEKAFAIVWAGFYEIAETHELLNETINYLERFPSNLPSNARYLRFLISNYLNEVYILSKRLEAYSKKLSRLYKGNPQFEALKQTVADLDIYTYKFFEEINLSRGKHVHATRYLDNDLESLMLLEATTHNKSLGLTNMYKTKIKSTKDHWIEVIKTTM
jgi:hypothetical protein